MTTLDDLFNKAKDVANAAGKKTGEVIEISKLKLQVVQYHADLQKSYEKLGTLVYQMSKNDCEDQNLINECIKEIDDLSEKIKDTEERVDDLRKVIKCASCGFTNPIESAYCSRCGAKLAEECNADTATECAGPDGEPAQESGEQKEDQDA